MFERILVATDGSSIGEPLDILGNGLRVGGVSSLEIDGQRKRCRFDDPGSIGECEVDRNPLPVRPSLAPAFSTA